MGKVCTVTQFRLGEGGGGGDTMGGGGVGEPRTGIIYTCAFYVHTYTPYVYRYIHMYIYTLTLTDNPVLSSLSELRSALKWLSKS